MIFFWFFGFFFQKEFFFEKFLKNLEQQELCKIYRFVKANFLAFFSSHKEIYKILEAQVKAEQSCRKF
jgi:hypothetical protein